MSSHDHTCRASIRHNSSQRAGSSDESNRAGVTVDAALSEFCTADITSQDDNTIRRLRGRPAPSSQGVFESVTEFHFPSRFNSRWPIVAAFWLSNSLLMFRLLSGDEAMCEGHS